MKLNCWTASGLWEVSVTGDYEPNHENECSSVLGYTVYYGVPYVLCTLKPPIISLLSRIHMFVTKITKSYYSFQVWTHVRGHPRVHQLSVRHACNKVMCMSVVLYRSEIRGSASPRPPLTNTNGTLFGFRWLLF